MTNTHSVIIAGAGPVGLFLACELGLRGVNTLVLERDPSPTSPWKSYPLGRRGLNTNTIEALYRRGMLDQALKSRKIELTFKKEPGFRFGGHFAGIPLNLYQLDLARFPYRIIGPGLGMQWSTLEDLDLALTARAEKLGVKIIRGSGVAGVSQDDEETVSVETTDGQTYKTQWLVGCDGGRSVVRKAAHFECVGTEPKFTGYAVQCTLENPTSLKPGIHPTRSGMYVVGENSLWLIDPDGGNFAAAQKAGEKEITLEHIQQVSQRVGDGENIKITAVERASCFTDRCKQATTYRKGRILLAGDAAHIHSPLGAQGLNAGIGDAMNLGWKLAATIQLQSHIARPLTAEDLSLLDTYDTERLPPGAWVLEWTRAQVQALLPDAHGQATRTLLKQLIATEDGMNIMLDQMWGLSLKYDSVKAGPDTHDFVGRSMPDFEFEDEQRAAALLLDGKGLLLSFGPPEKTSELEVIKSYGDKVNSANRKPKDGLGLETLLIRPDGVVAWVAEEGKPYDLGALNVALNLWFGI